MRRALVIALVATNPTDGRSPAGTAWLDNNVVNGSGTTSWAHSHPLIKRRLSDANITLDQRRRLNPCHYDNTKKTTVIAVQGWLGQLRGLKSCSGVLSAPRNQTLFLTAFVHAAQVCKKPDGSVYVGPGGGGDAQEAARAAGGGSGSGSGGTGHVTSHVPKPPVAACADPKVPGHKYNPGDAPFVLSCARPRA